MTATAPFDDPFLHKYESFENESTEDFIKRHSRTQAELRETIDFLIRHRELVRDIELQKIGIRIPRVGEKAVGDRSSETGGGAELF